MSKPALQLKRGDTLIEVVFSLAILATLLTVITTAAISAWRTSRLAGERTQAAAYAQEEIEALRAYRAGLDWTLFDAIITNPSKQTFNMQPQAGAWYPVDGFGTVGNFGLKIEKTDVSKPNLIQFTATVTWKSLGSNVANTSTQLVELGANQ